MPTIPLKAALVLFLAAGLAPLAAAHACEEGEFGIDIDHLVFACVPAVCVKVLHACADTGGEERAFATTLP